MNELGMTSLEIKKQIKKEERYLKRCRDKILDIESDIKSTERCIKWWSRQLKIYERGEKKNEKH